MRTLKLTALLIIVLLMSAWTGERKNQVIIRADDIPISKEISFINEFYFQTGSFLWNSMGWNIFFERYENEQLRFVVGLAVNQSEQSYECVIGDFYPEFYLDLILIDYSYAEKLSAPVPNPFVKSRKKPSINTSRTREFWLYEIVLIKNFTRHREILPTPIIIYDLQRQYSVCHAYFSIFFDL